MKPKDPNTPYQLHGVNISYFTGKLEAYMRYKDIPIELVDGCDLDKNFFHTGIQKMPAVEMSQGQWLYGTTPTIEWFESIYPDIPITPKYKALAFFFLLFEDYGDEWLWRPAMWWRWKPPVSPRTLGTRIMKGAMNVRDKVRVDALFALVGRISKILNARQINAGINDLFAMPKPSLMGTHIALSSSRGWCLGAQPRS